ncbi:DNA-3-methyladenine glycosylase [Acidocella sp.]|uniref:DNA-3-methyladenine glycosylase family protein n=1 Tax=Acidocella sp. TaxID=50710 RepID=UPI002613A6D4|nr:DNA-3-methyladenine glycosylase 2 family protein [Acidocella sp.]
MAPPTQQLSKADPVLGALIARVGPLKPRLPEHSELYPALLSAIAHQQLHANAALAILGRLKAACGGILPDPAALLALPDERLRGCGFSATKMAAIRDTAAKAIDGTIPSRVRARRLSDDALIERLTTIRGVGRWTVEMLLIFTLRRPDVFPVDDFGVREGYRLLHMLDMQPKPKALAEIGKAYAPHRTLAALYLWRAADEMKKPSTTLSKA